MAAAVPDDVETQLRLGVPPAYRDALFRVRFPLETLKELSRIRPGRVTFEVAATVGLLVAVPFVYALAPGFVAFVFCALLNIRVFNSFAQLVHTSDHGGLLPTARFNKLLGNVCAYCLGYTQRGHRLAHLNHHLYLNTEKDPDLIWGRPDDTSRQLIRAWIRDLLFVSAFGRLLQYSQRDRAAFSVAPWRSLTPRFLWVAAVTTSPVVVAQAAIFAIYSAVLSPLHYVLLWIVPIMTLYPAQIRLRSTVEHSFDVEGRSPAADVWVTRTTVGNLVERWIMSPFGTHHHFEHHLFPAIPHYQLDRLHRLLVECGYPVPQAPGYVTFVIRKVRAERRAHAATARP